MDDAALLDAPNHVEAAAAAEVELSWGLPVMKLMVLPWLILVLKFTLIPLFWVLLLNRGYRR